MIYAVCGVNFARGFCVLGWLLAGGTTARDRGGNSRACVGGFNIPNGEPRFMTPEQHIFHAAPLVWLAKTKLHANKPLAVLVREMRSRRWRDNLPKPEPMNAVKIEPNTNETETA